MLPPPNSKKATRTHRTLLQTFVNGATRSAGIFSRSFWSSAARNGTRFVPATWSF